MNELINGVMIPQRISPFLVLKQLCLELYTEIQALAELLRNGANAHMLNAWEPQRVRIEVNIVNDYPLAPNVPTLLFLDHGCGFTNEAYSAIEELGPKTKIEQATLHGSKQKNIGRLAPFKLIRNIEKTEDINAGFYVVTRSLSSGPVQIFHYTAKKIAENAVCRYELDPNCVELGPYRGIKGSFCMVVVPNVIYSNIDDLRKDLSECLPRLNDLALDVKVDGKPLSPPPLPKHYVEGGGIRAWLGRPKNSSIDGGILLVDADTGFVCAHARKLNHTHMPYTLANPELFGVIAIKNLLANQDTGRSTLLPSFLKSTQWKKTMDMLRLHICPFAQDLLGDDDVIQPANPHHSTLMELADMFDACFGIPKIKGQSLPDVITGGLLGSLEENENEDERKNKEPESRKPTRRLRGKRGDPPLGPIVKVRGRSVNIGTKTYVLRMQPHAHKLEYAIISGGNYMGINPNYIIQCGCKTAHSEHLLMRILMTAARDQIDSTDNAEPVEIYAADLRYKLLRAKKAQ